MAGFPDWFRNTFSFLFTRSSQEDRLATYLIREHERGRALEEILDDPYVTNRAQPDQVKRLLDRPEVIHALGASTVAAEQEKL
jgi:hypothetical protein